MFSYSPRYNLLSNGQLLICYIFQQSFNRNCRLNIYSGHDYTILCILGSLNITRKISNASHFGSYLIFELWDRAGSDIGDASPSQDCDTVTVSVTRSVDCNTGTVDPVQESCSVVGVGDTIAFDNTLRQARSGVALYGCNRHGDGDGYGESDNTLCSCDGTPPNEVADATATAIANDVTLNEKIQKSDGLQTLLGLSENKNKFKNVFLQTIGDEVEDQRFLRISANFSPFEARDDTLKERLNHEVNEKNIVLLAELSIREIKEKHDFLFQSLTSRGYFVPLISTSAVSQR